MKSRAFGLLLAFLAVISMITACNKSDLTLSDEIGYSETEKELYISDDTINKLSLEIIKHSSEYSDMPFFLDEANFKFYDVTGDNIPEFFWATPSYKTVDIYVYSINNNTVSELGYFTTTFNQNFSKGITLKLYNANSGIILNSDTELYSGEYKRVQQQFIEFVENEGTIHITNLYYSVYGDDIVYRGYNDDTSQEITEKAYKLYLTKIVGDNLKSVDFTIEEYIENYTDQINLNKRLMNSYDVYKNDDCD